MLDLLGILAFALLGFILGFVSGLTPGLHVNSLAFILVGFSSAFSGYPLAFFGVAMVSAAITHTFLNIIPSVVLGVPEDSMALTALPGHRMVLEGEGKEAIYLSAAGSMLATTFAFVFALPLSFVMVGIYPVLDSYMAFVLAGVAVFMLVTERGVSLGRRTSSSEKGEFELISRLSGIFPALVVLGSSGLLGFYVLENSGEATSVIGEPTLLMPLFTGLFGLPLLAVSAFENADIPRQKPPRIDFSKPRLAVSAAGGGLAGGIVGWIPGVSSAVATTLVQTFLPRSETEDESMRSFIVAVSGVNTSNAVFALLAFYFIKRERSGVVVALSELGAEVSIDTVATYLAAIAFVSLLGFVSTLAVGSRCFSYVRAVNYRLLSVAIALFLVLLTLLLSGPLGIPILVAGAVIGLVPNYTQVRRIHCMGSLLLPLIYYSAF